MKFRFFYYITCIRMWFYRLWRRLIKGEEIAATAKGRDLMRYLEKVIMTNDNVGAKTYAELMYDEDIQKVMDRKNCDRITAAIVIRTYYASLIPEYRYSFYNVEGEDDV